MQREAVVFDHHRPTLLRLSLLRPARCLYSAAKRVAPAGHGPPARNSVTQHLNSFQGLRRSLWAVGPTLPRTRRGAKGILSNVSSQQITPVVHKRKHGESPLPSANHGKQENKHERLPTMLRALL